MRFQGAIALLAVSVVAGSVYFWYLLPQGRERRLADELAARFFRVDGSGIEFIRIRNSRGVFDLVREEGSWRIRVPRAAIADGDAVGAILRLVESGRIGKLIASDPGELAPYGLANPAVVLSLGFAGRVDELALGSANPANTGVYAYAKGIHAVFLVDKEIAAALDVDLFSLRSKALFVFDPDAITGIIIRKQDGMISLEKEGGDWMMRAPRPGRASGDAVRAYLAALAGQRALEIYDGDLPPVAYPRTLTLELARGADKAAHVIELRYWGTGQGEGIVARQQGVGHAGRLAREFWMAADRGSPHFRYRNLFRFEEQDLGRITVQRGAERYDLVRSFGGWKIDGKPVDERKAMQFVWFLRSWSAVRFAETAEAPAETVPVLEISLADRSGRGLGSLAVYGPTGEGPVGRTAAGPVVLQYARSSDLSEPCIVDSGELENVPREKDLIP